MNRRYTFILTFIILISGIKLLAQADISNSIHWNNRAGYNPAFIARPDYLYLFSDTRRQWIGVDGAPVVYNVQVSEYIHSLRSAFGLSFVSDKVGVTKVFNPMFTYAFRIAKKTNWALSMGLSTGLFIRTIDGSRFEAENSSDPSIFTNLEKLNKPDFNAGVEFQSTHFIYGISSTHLFSLHKTDSTFLNTNHRYGYAIYRNDNMKYFSYSAGMQMENRYNLTIVEGNFSVRIKHQLKLIMGRLIKGQQEILDFGVNYSSSRRITALMGMMITPYMRIGYAYDQSLLSKYSRNQTHEIMLEYRIPSRSASTVLRCVDKEFWYR
jgi:type IX secretion system PorP/SprF family membrane protein